MIENVCIQLQALQRKRATLIRMRLMLCNSLAATLAVADGYSTKQTEKERKERFAQARSVIETVIVNGGGHDYADVILATQEGISAFAKQQKSVEKIMLRLAAKLPVFKWVQESEQRGFGELSLAVLVGECGDLSLYASPAKVWRRMGLAPWTFDGVTHMGSTWRYGKEGKLPAEEWSNFGYVPRRRSIAYLFGEGMVKQNQGRYRERYDQVKAESALKHPDWKPKRHHLHAMLIATKMLLKYCWRAWHGQTGIDVGPLAVAAMA